RPAPARRSTRQAEDRDAGAQESPRDAEDRGAMAQESPQGVENRGRDGDSGTGDRDKPGAELRPVSASDLTRSYGICGHTTNECVTCCHFWTCAEPHKSSEEVVALQALEFPGH